MKQRGLYNLGNTCYLNSALQALRHAGPFATYFGTDAWTQHRHEDRGGYELAQEVSTLIKDFGKDGPRAINPGSLVRAFFKVAKERGLDDEFHPGAQADGTEAVLLILQVLHEQQARHVKMEITGVPKSKTHIEYVKSLEAWSNFFRKEYSSIVEDFYGQTLTRLVCKCGHEIARYEPWGVLKVPIPNADVQGAPAPSLQQCIAKGFEKEALVDYMCESCKEKGGVSQELSISRFPSHMILGIKRYTNRGAKVQAKIAYDPDLVDFTEWITWPSIQKKCRYQVYAVVDQWGNSRGGHYNMRARSGSGWSLYDDQTHSPSPNGGESNADTLMLFLERLP